MTRFSNLWSRSFFDRSSSWAKHCCSQRAAQSHSDTLFVTWKTPEKTAWICWCNFPWIELVKSVHQWTVNNRFVAGQPCSWWVKNMGSSVFFCFNFNQTPFSSWISYCHWLISQSQCQLPLHLIISHYAPKFMKHIYVYIRKYYIILLIYKCVTITYIYILPLDSFQK